MQKRQYIIGADISKKKIDLYSHFHKKHICISNDKTGHRQLILWLKQLCIVTDEVFFVMEHTGLYSFCLEAFLHKQKLSFCKVSALSIKRSMGLVRGKSDSLDARRIALYGYEKQEQLLPEMPVDKSLQRMQLLYAARDRVVKQKASLLNVIEEYRNMGITKSDTLMCTQSRLVKALEKELSVIEAEIAILIEDDKELNTNYRLLQSIKGVGPVLALAVLIKTRNFTRFVDPRKFACYCGTAPFEHSSGSSIRGRTKVSHFADKQMKTLLELAARSAVQCDEELKLYYQRRVASGKAKRSTLNVVRNKLLYRIFAVVKRKTPFVPDYLKAA